MIDYVIEYLEGRGVHCNMRSYELFEQGIRRFLEDHGIPANETGRYYRHYVTTVLDRVYTDDLIRYLVSYPSMCEIRQIVIDYQTDGYISAERKCQLRGYMKDLYQMGIGDKYIPRSEVQQILTYIPQAPAT